MNSSTGLEIRIEALESRNAFQDDVIEQLNNEIAKQQQEISELKFHLQTIAARLKDGAGNLPTSNQVEPPPPHY